MEDWTDGRLDGGSVLGRQVRHDLQVEEPEFGDRRQRDVKVRVDAADQGRWTVDDGRFARWNPSLLSGQAVGTFGAHEGEEHSGD
jgi:hypothetical protein